MPNTCCRPPAVLLAASVTLVSALLAAPRAAAAAPTVGSTLTAACVGGAIGCEQVDFFLMLQSPEQLAALDFLTLTVTGPSFTFSVPAFGEAEDALGPVFVSPTVSSGGTVFTAEFPFGALAAPALRLRTQFATFGADASALRVRYVGGTAADAEVVSGTLQAAVVPEPVPAALLGLALGGVALAARSRQTRTV